MAPMPLAFGAAGPAHAPALRLPYGSVVTRKMWRPQPCDLSDEYRVIAPDLPEHGTLAPPFRMPSGYLQTLYNRRRMTLHSSPVYL
jgi:pimeloyl-ACP methyl ester carboxylesterase